MAPVQIWAALALLVKVGVASPAPPALRGMVSPPYESADNASSFDLANSSGNASSSDDAITEAERAQLAGNLTALSGWGASPSCSYYWCSANYAPGQPCQCEVMCMSRGDCCHDYAQVCKPAWRPQPPTTRRPVWNPQPPTTRRPVWNPQPQLATCASFGCGQFVHGRQCQCTAECWWYRNCCSDYEHVCRSHAVGPPTPAPEWPPRPTTQAPEWPPPWTRRPTLAPTPAWWEPVPTPAWWEPEPTPAPTPPPPTPASNSPTPAGAGSSSQVFTFYMYRAQGAASYPPKNVNTANIAGVMWYLQHEVMVKDPPKFGIKRILRYRVQVRAPPALAARGMTFGVRYAYDSQKCTGPGKCSDMYGWYGYFVGCNKFTSNYPYPTAESHGGRDFPGGIWYSLPGEGACSDHQVCTYNYTYPPDEVTIEEVQRGNGRSFWDRGSSVQENDAKVTAALEAFKRKYPNTEEHPTPECDFNFDQFWGPVPPP